MKNIFIIGSKSIGQYGGYETFVDKLTEYHQHQKDIKYHIACKANGDGFMDESKLDKISDVTRNNDGEVVNFTYHNADVFKIKVPNIGPAVAIYYDIAALNYCIKYCKKHKIEKPVFYILACRIGPFIHMFKKQIHAIGGELYINPDGHEWKRKKWAAPIRKYWKLSEKLMVKDADLVICDSVNIEKYIQEEYKKYNPNTTYISYGAEIIKSTLKDNDSLFTDWLNKHKLSVNNYYLIVGRFVPENNYETIIREFMDSTTKRDLVIVTNVNDKFLNTLENNIGFKKDKRIKFVGTVYNQQLLKKIRENAYAYIHGHEVGGTNPSLLEALGSTKLNLLLNVGFNKEVGENAALYWEKTNGDLCKLINTVDIMDSLNIERYNSKSKERISKFYSWSLICNQYRYLWNNSPGEK